MQPRASHSSPKLVAISRVKNEADIIEAFVRHHSFYFDQIIVLDHGSSDATYEILGALQREGLPLVVFREASIGYDQNRYMTKLLHCAVSQFGADWVAPLDADEFIEPPPDLGLANILPREPAGPLTLGWNNFVWRKEDQGNEINPVLRLKLRMPVRLDQTKV